MRDRSWHLKDDDMQLSRSPRIRLGHLPTPLELMPRLSAMLGPEIWIKRDDCTGLSALLPVFGPPEAGLFRLPHDDGLVTPSG